MKKPSNYKQTSYFLCIGLATTLAPCFANGSAPVTVNVGGNNYELRIADGTYADIQDQLECTPWFGLGDGGALAATFAETLESDLGNLYQYTGPGGTGEIPNFRPLFAFDEPVYGYNQPVGDFAQVVVREGMAGMEQTNICDPGNCNFRASLDYEYSYVVANGAEITEIIRSFAPLSGSYTKLPDLIMSNVPTCDGSTFVNGFQIIGNGQVQWFVENSKKDLCFNSDVTVLPAGVSAKVLEDIFEFFGSSEFDVITHKSVETTQACGG